MDPVERQRPRWGRIILRLVRWAAVGIPVAFILAYAISADVRYLARAGAQEARLLWRRRAIADLVKDPRTPPALKQRLRLGAGARGVVAASPGAAVGGREKNHTGPGRPNPG